VCSLVLLLQFQFRVGVKGMADVVDVLIAAAGEGDEDGDVLVFTF